MNNAPRRSKLAGLTPAKPGQTPETRQTTPAPAKAVRQTKITVRLANPANPPVILGEMD